MNGPPHETAGRFGISIDRERTGLPRAGELEAGAGPRAPGAVGNGPGHWPRHGSSGYQFSGDLESGNVVESHLSAIATSCLFSEELTVDQRIRHLQLTQIRVDGPGPTH